MSAADSARMEVVQCERDIQAIKAALRQVSSADANKPNSLEVIWTKLDGTEADDAMEVSLQLSSPVEELAISKIREGEEAVEGSSVSFAGVEASMATLTVTLKKDGKIVGTSENYDMAPICSLGDAMKPKSEYVTELPVAIVAAPGEEAAFIEEEKPKEEETPAEEEKPTEEATTEEAAADSAEAEKEEGAEDDKKETAAEEDKKDDAKEESTTTTTSAVVKPLCTLSLKMVFKPSAKDQKEELYELLNKASLRRSQALERHRGEQSAVVAASPRTGKAQAVKAGFLNKKPKKAEKPENKIMQFYNKYLGPKSLGRSVIFPIAKNYVIFFGAAILFHFKGQELALPSPV